MQSFDTIFSYLGTSDAKIQDFFCEYTHFIFPHFVSFVIYDFNIRFKLLNHNA